MAPQKEKQVLMNYQKQANYRERKNKEDDEANKLAKVEKKKRDRLRYLTKKTSTMEHKLTDLQQKQRLLALQGATLQVDTALAQQQEVKLVMQIKAMKEEFNSHMETSQD